MADYLTPCTVSGPSELFNFDGRCSLTIDFADRIRAFSPNAGTLIELRSEPAPTADRRYSFREVFSSPTEIERDAAAAEHAAFEANLKSRVDKKEVSRLYYYRCIRGMTQEQLAELAGSRQSFLSQLEKRKKTLTWKQAEKFAAVLEIDPAELMEKR